MRYTQLARKVRHRVWPSRPWFATEDVEVGRNVRFGRNIRFDCRRVRIGNGCVFCDNVHIQATDFTIGNYASIYDSCLFPGPGSIEIGHNFWLGHRSMVDSAGGTAIGNNVGVGAQSQLWTHIQFGDTLSGCRFASHKPLLIGNDVWFVGHCLVSPITAGDRSMAMLGSTVIKDMAADRTYAGSPASDMTDRFGSQFTERALQSRVVDLNGRLDHLLPNPIERTQVRVVTDASDATVAEAGVLVLNVESRSYSDTNHPLELRVIRGLLPKAKFVPRLY
jgi:acetyltransferase-like isoleucine patch superfamily enzyme